MASTVARPGAGTGRKAEGSGAGPEGLRSHVRGPTAMQTQAFSAVELLKVFVEMEKDDMEEEDLEATIRNYSALVNSKGEPYRLG